jgi:hypothetical protein
MTSNPEDDVELIAGENPAVAQRADAFELHKLRYTGMSP